MTTAQPICSKCGCRHEIEVLQSINARQRPDLKAAALNGGLFTWKCPSCGAVNLLNYPLLYHDPEERLLIVLSAAAVNADDVPEGYTGRQVRTAGDFIEKLKIFDAGLDDVIVEMCKFVTRRELGKDVSLKFLRFDGADQEMIFTYPQDGKMEMLSVGFNVYQDCGAIIQRNPAIAESVHGLASVDAGWLEGFVG